MIALSHAAFPLFESKLFLDDVSEQRPSQRKMPLLREEVFWSDQRRSLRGRAESPTLSFNPPVPTLAHR
jgi:hypothetical protein